MRNLHIPQVAQGDKNQKQTEKNQKQVIDAAFHRLNLQKNKPTRKITTFLSKTKITNARNFKHNFKLTL